MSFAIAAADLGAKVALSDFVTPTPRGTKWGLGGTCVNVGCVPKILMHQAAMTGEKMEAFQHFGWTGKTDGSNPAVKHDWRRMVDTVQKYITSMNFENLKVSDLL